MKLLEDALAKYGTLGKVQRALKGYGIKISRTALWLAWKNGNMRFQGRIALAFRHIVYNGDDQRWLAAYEADLGREAINEKEIKDEIRKSMFVGGVLGGGMADFPNSSVARVEDPPAGKAESKRN